MKIEHLHFVEEIARAGSINRAAEALNVKQPYLSSILLDLEQEAGVKLFSRHSWGVSLTEAGVGFLEAARVIQEGYNQILGLRHTHGEEAGEAFTVANTYSYTLLDIFNDFLNQNPACRSFVSYLEIPPQQILDTLHQGKAAIGFTIRDMYQDTFDEELKKKKLQFHRLCEEPFYLVLSKDHPLAEEKSLSSRQMQDYTFVVDRGKRAFHAKIFTWWYESDKISPLLFDNNRSVMYYLTKNPHCFSVGQKSLNLTNPFVTSGDLKYIRWEDSPYLLRTGYVVHKSRKLSPCAEAFLEHVEAFFKAYKVED
ncbi:MAG: LysR family transcriptional regulator [Clostridiales bacterium]|nr:LysR family transcriptional regulator [Clostridiales bacterium]